MRAYVSINIAEIKHKTVGHVTLEISNDDEFIARINEINRQLPGTKAEKMKLWKIRVVGEERVPAKIRHLVEGSGDGDEDSTETQEVNPKIPSSDFGAASPPPDPNPKPTRRLARRAGGPSRLSS